jgi:hypothetical protein
MVIRRLGELLVAKGRLSNEQLQKALQAQMIWGGHLGTNLIELGYITEDELGEVLAEAHSVGYATYEMLQEIPSTVLNSIPKGLVEKYKIVPFLFDGKKLHMVMLRPTDLMALDEVSFATGFQLVPYVTPEIRLFQILEKHYNIPRARRYITLSRELANRAAAKGTPAGKAPSKSAGPNDRARPASSILDAAPSVTPSVGKPDAQETPDLSAPDSEDRESGAVVKAIGVDPYAENSAMDWSPAAEPRAPTPPVESPARTPSELVPKPLPESAAQARTDAGLDSLLRAQTLEEVCSALTEEAAGAFKRCAVFARTGDEFISIAGLSAATPSWSIDGLALPFDGAFAEALFSNSRTYYIAAPPGELTHAAFYQKLGGPPPPNVFLAPIRLSERIAMIFYGDQFEEEIRPREIDSVLNMVHQAGLALDLLQLRRKDSPG